LKLVGTLAVVIAFIIALIVLVLVASAYRKNLGKPSERVMISKYQIFLTYSPQTMFQIQLVTMNGKEVFLK